MGGGGRRGRIGVEGAEREDWSGRTEQEDGSGRTEREKWTGAMEWEGGKEGRK